MMDFFNSLEPLQKFFWIVACCASLVFIIQTVMTFIGLGTDTDVDAGPMDGSIDSVEDGITVIPKETAVCRACFHSAI